MSDITDDASTVESMWSELAIRQAHAEANQPAKSYASCQYCGDPTEDGRKFCCYGPVSCASDFNHRERILIKQGYASWE